MRSARPDSDHKLRLELAAALDEEGSIDWGRVEDSHGRRKIPIAAYQLLEGVVRAHRSAVQTHRSAATTGGEPSSSGSATAAAGLGQWGPFRLLEHLGSGSFGEIYRAQDTVLLREVALKLRQTDRSIAASRRNLEEARNLARVRHPNVLVVHGADIHGGQVGLWTDLVPGRTLADRLEAEGTLPAAEAVLIGIELCRALSAIHAAGLVHGDLKAANVLCEETGRIIVADFGSAILFAEHPSDPGGAALTGTPIAMAPELFRGETPRATSDLYALGVLLYQLLSGRHPVTGKTILELEEKHRRGERVPLHEARPDLPAVVVEAVEQALAQRAEDRPPSAEALREILATTLLAFEVHGDDQGQSLRDLQNEMGRLPETFCRYIGREIAAALARLHATGRTFRHLRPETVFIRAGRTIELVEPPAGEGTLHYAAPEQMAGESGVPDGRADLFALGVMLCELATGKHPHPARDFADYRRRVLADEEPSMDAAALTLTPFFQEIIRTLLARKPEARFRSAAELEEVLAEAERSEFWSDRSSRLTAARPRRLVTSPQTAFCGRRSEMGKLTQAWDAVCNGEARVVLLTGEAGIGKSRLLGELVDAVAANADEVHLLAGSSAPTSETRSLSGFAAAYRAHLGGQDPARALAALLPEAPPAAQALAALISGSDDGHAEASASEPLQVALVETALALARQRPTLLMLEDLHFAAEEERNAFLVLARTAPGHRLLLVASARSDLPAEWQSELERLPHTARIDLGGLSDDDSRIFLTDLLGSEILADELRGELVHRSDGNPFVMLELLRVLEGNGQLVRGADGRWKQNPHASIRDFPLPETLANLIRARAAQLGPAEREVLETASCCGFGFDPMLIAEARRITPLVLFRSLAALEHPHRLLRSGEPSYSFEHHYVQEAIYSGLPPALRQTYHLAIAESLEKRLEGAREPDAAQEPATIRGAQAVDLALHFLRGGALDRVLPLLEAAVGHLEATLNSTALLALVSEVLQHEDALPERERIDLLLRQAQHLAILGHHREQHRVYERALLTAETTGDAVLRARVRTQLGRYLSDRSHYTQARTVLVQALELSRAAEHGELEAKAMSGLGSIDCLLGRYEEAIQESEQAIGLARRVQSLADECEATKNLGSVHLTQGRPAAARDCFERALDLARATGAPQLEAAMLGRLGSAQVDLGDWEAAESCFRRQIALCRRSGYRQGEGRGSGSLARVLFRRGKLEEARTLWERQLTIQRQTGYRKGEATALGNLSLLADHMGQFAEAMRLREEHVSLSREMADAEGILFGECGNAAYYTYLGDHPRARTAFRAALSLARSLNQTPREVTARLYGCILAEHEGDLTRAAAEYKEAAAMARKNGTRWAYAQMLLTYGDFLRRHPMQADPTRGASLLEEALVIGREIGSAQVEVCALTSLAMIKRDDPAPAAAAFSASASQMSALSRMEVAFNLWRLTGEGRYLAEAHRILIYIRDHAPEEYRESMMSQVPLHREIRAAWEAGTA